jgi:hypothetical protein
LHGFPRNAAWRLRASAVAKASGASQGIGTLIAVQSRKEQSHGGDRIQSAALKKGRISVQVSGESLRRLGGMCAVSALCAAVVPINSASFNNDWKFTLWLVLGLVASLMLIECVSVVSLFRLRSEAALKRDLKVFGEF